MRYGQEHAKRVRIAVIERRGKVTMRISHKPKGLAGSNGKVEGMGLKIMDYFARLIAGESKPENADGGGNDGELPFRPKE